MTSEEIKNTTTMRDVIGHYGLPQPNRQGFIPCPFHKGDREPSMKIHEKDYHCFACGENGDIFTFVQRMEDLSFKEAFFALGGTYPDKEQENWFSKQRRRYEAEKRRKTAQKRAAMEQAEKSALIRETHLLGLCIRYFEPLTDDWCESYNAWQKAEYRLEYLNEKR